MSVDVINESGDRTADEAEISACARFVLDRMHVHPRAELAVVLVDSDAMAALNAKWMDEPGPTDVLSFPMDELRPGTEAQPSAAGILGDVVLCPEVAQAQARKAGHAPAEELLLLTVHGLLHLLGYDHAEPDERHQMFTLQRHLLLTFLAER